MRKIELTEAERAEMISMTEFCINVSDEIRDHCGPIAAGLKADKRVSQEVAQAHYDYCKEKSKMLRQLLAKLEREEDQDD